MNRRTSAAVVGVMALIGLAIALAVIPTNYVVFRPGPTINVLGEDAGKPIIAISGHKTYRDDGGLRLVTIIPTGPNEKVGVFGVLGAWADPSRAAYPRDVIYQPTDTADSVKQQSSAQMTSSQDSAIAAALRVLGIRFSDSVAVATVDADGPSNGKLKAGDRLLSVNGAQVGSVNALIKMIKALPPGTAVRVGISRDGKQSERTITTAPSAADKTKSAIKVAIAPSYNFPFKAELRLADNIGGPSAGLMFSLGVYDVLTPGSLTGGKMIAGTGTIDAQGKVGEIGGIEQKIAGAQRDGARLFLVPAGNCAEAAHAHYDKDKITLVRVATLEEAIHDLDAWRKDKNTRLARCTR